MISGGPLVHAINAWDPTLRPIQRLSSLHVARS